MKENNSLKRHSSSDSDQEISLIDIWRTITRHYKLVFVIFILVLLAAVTYILSEKRVYQSQATIQVGQIGQIAQVVLINNTENNTSIGLLENIDALQQRLLAENPELESVTTKRNSAQNVITLSLHAETRIEAEKQLSKITNKLLEDHRILFNKVHSPLQKRYDSLQELIISLYNQISEVDAQIRSLKSNRLELAAMLMIEKGNISRAIPELEEAITNLQLVMNEPRTSQSRLLGSLITPDNPIKPRTNLIIVLAVLFGLLLGIFSAYFAEFITKSKLETN